MSLGFWSLPLLSLSTIITHWLHFAAKVPPFGIFDYSDGLFFACAPHSCALTLLLCPYASKGLPSV